MPENTTEKPADRVTRYLDTYKSMGHLHPEEIHSVGSATSDHETVTLLVSDLRSLVAPSQATVTVGPARPQTDDELPEGFENGAVAEWFAAQPESRGGRR